jgi:hypothetical protein
MFHRLVLPTYSIKFGGKIQALFLANSRFDRIAQDRGNLRFDGAGELFGVLLRLRMRFIELYREVDRLVTETRKRPLFGQQRRKGCGNQIGRIL